jgi:hypothetical protein
VLEEIIDNVLVGPAIVKMRWTRVSVAGSEIPLLTSDRPLDMPVGLENDKAYIVLPIGPHLLFVADHDGDSAKRLASFNPTEIVKAINLSVVSQARKFVWGVDDTQRRFVENHISKAPDRPIARLRNSKQSKLC